MLGFPIPATSYYGIGRGLMQVSKKKGRNWSTPLEEAQQEAVDFAQGICMSLNILQDLISGKLK